jgi:hypothetical protein
VFVPQTPTPLPPTSTPEPQPQPAGDLTWVSYVDPLFANKCAACHGIAGGLSFATYADALRGSQDGPVIIPGDAASRLIVVQAAGGHPGQLNADELAKVSEWIVAGAPEE